MLGAPIVHEVGLTLAMIIGAVALGRGVREHGFVLPSAVGVLGLGVMACAMTLREGGYEPLFTIVGVMILALGHRLNIMAAQHELLIACSRRRRRSISRHDHGAGTIISSTKASRSRPRRASG